MKYFAGLDVSLKEISLCVVDDEGAVVCRKSLPFCALAVADALAKQELLPERIVHESGQISIWLQRQLEKLGLPAICIDARSAHKVLSAKLNKSDRSDAEGLAQLARIGWFTAVHVRSEDADRLRTIIGARDRFIRLRMELEAHVRGILKTFGIRLPAPLATGGSASGLEIRSWQRDNPIQPWQSSSITLFHPTRRYVQPPLL